MGDGEMTIRFHNEDGRELFTTTVMSERSYSLLASTQKVLERSDYIYLSLLGLGSCLFSFILAFTWCHCRKSQNELSEDLMMETNDG
eukprot:TRINITY_DN248_c0_g3_i7.p1 TRINITY_DN248_c0_g3~~TRINITY_DN248_c0_g3_i7.p1  ORF type:complete len:87 (+),score=4.65 TRINITY_DN248_c0_g3_i7:56-316(+)